MAETTTPEEKKMPATCTVRSAVHGVCGKPAVYTFESRIAIGETFGECAEHHHGPVHEEGARRIGEHRVGDKVEIHRYGRVYIGTVVHVGARGAAYAEFTYDKGTTRRVRVEA